MIVTTILSTLLLNASSITVKSVISNSKVAVASGIKPDTIKSVAVEQPDLIIVGGGIANADDPNAAKVICGVGYLAHTVLNINQYAVHQFFPKDNGLKVDLGIFVPQGVPDESVIGHMEHFAIEFSSVFKNLIDMMRQQSEK